MTVPMASSIRKKRRVRGPFLLILLIFLFNFASVTSLTEESACSLAEDGSCHSETEESNVGATNETGDDKSNKSAEEEEGAGEEVNKGEEKSENKVPPFDEKQLVFPCIDEDEECDFLAFEGECVAKAESMIYRCSKSCDACTNIIDWDMGKPQRLIPGHESRIWKRIIKARRYLNNYVAEDPVLSQSLPACLLDDPRCAIWAAQGECEKNPNYMRHKCGPMCESCEDTSAYTRCNIDYTEPNAWEPGDLNAMFGNLTTLEAFKKYEPKVWSRPSYVNGDTEDTADYILGPWVVTLENVMSQEEADRLIELGTDRGYRTSIVHGGVNPDGTSKPKENNEHRTSKNAWCEWECAEDPVTIAVTERIANFTNVNINNSEYMQLLRYQEGEYYKAHHDLIDHDIRRQPGVRILTVFLYLNTVEVGGGTNFTELNITVQPKRGRVLIWPSVLDEAPHKKDERTYHEALPIIKGEKYSANFWFHQRNYKEPYHRGC